MPYIKQERRDPVLLGMPQDAGELNYIITVMILDYFKTPGKGNYQAINDIIGALEGAKAEFQRRIVVPYEDRKIAENGDVY